MSMADKLFVIGVDGMDPRLTRKYVDEGKMPNVKQLIERGAMRHDLVMLGSHPTITPPMWTSLATGAFPVTHGVTCFFRQTDQLDQISYNLDSQKCTAEQLWNVFAESGKKTLVWHWPGSSWPPTSDSENLYVVDGTQPPGVGCGVATVDSDFIFVADSKTEGVLYKEKAAQDTKVPCMINDLEMVESKDFTIYKTDMSVNAKPTNTIILQEEDGEGAMTDKPFDVVLSSIKDATNWFNAPSDAKEVTVLFGKGYIHRVGLLLKNKEGIYDKLALYQSKKDAEPYAVLEKNVFASDIMDVAVRRDGSKCIVNRNMRVIEMAEDGTHLKMWVSTAMDTSNDTLWHPKAFHKTITENVGFPQPMSILGGADERLIRECAAANWDAALDWTARALNYCIAAQNFEVIFSHVHNIDMQGHMIVKFLKDKGNAKLSHEVYLKLLEEMYTQTDRYLGKYLHLLDEGWTLFVVSDHAQVSSEHKPPMTSDPSGVNMRLMHELGYTYAKLDADGNELHEVDWAKTRAVAVRGNHIYINLKGRAPQGWVDPQDQYELEESIMTDLYGYRDPQTRKRVIALALRNKDAIHLGMGGPECGDIIYWLAEGYNYDHGDSLSSTFGHSDTSVSPIFMAAGKGLKQGYETNRIIRIVDLAPTMATLAGVRMPRECEGAPIYQILAD